MVDHSPIVSLDVSTLFPDCPSSSGLILDLDPDTLSAVETPEALRFTMQGRLRNPGAAEESL